VKYNYPKIEKPTTSKTSHSRLSNTVVVKSTATNTDRMEARIVIGVQRIFLNIFKNCLNESPDRVANSK